ncbi:O-acetyl-ADP-ribose deacetylase [Aquimarina rhabdastrellae]
MKIELLKGDITKVAVDAIVNAANSSLLGGGGVDGAIHRRGGKAILEACQKIRNTQGKCKIGEAVITTAGNLDANYVIHTVGPIYNGGEKERKEKDLLANCYTNALHLAVKHSVKTIAFPNISTGTYRFPKDKAAKIAIATVQNFENINEIEKVLFVCFDEENYNLYKEILKS